MKPILILLAFCLPPLTLPAQYELEVNLDNSCSYYGESITDQIYSFTSSQEAEEIVANILEVVGLKPNFEIKAGNVPNALATIQDGKRLILYSQNFILKMNSTTGTDWAGISILAHEIGHHLNGHTISGSGSRPSLELEADEWSGFVLAKMGATLEEAQKAITTASSDRGSQTHPPKSARLEAIAVGWNKGNKYRPATTDIQTGGSGQPESNSYPPTQTKTNPTNPANSNNFTSVIVAYTGDNYGCMLPISITIGGYVFQPTGNWFTVSNIPAGRQPYQITGQIQCGTYGTCQAFGEGYIDVYPNQTFYVGWQNTDVGQCSIWLTTY